MSGIRSQLPIFFARTRMRSVVRFVGIKPADRLFHALLIGKTGTGKSTLIETMALEDIHRGNGIALIDPHGDLVSRIASRIPVERHGDVRYLNVPDPAQPFGYNPLRPVHPDRIPLAASGLLEAMKMAWSDAWGVRMEHILRNAIYALLERDDATLKDIPRLFADKAYRREVAAGLKNEAVRAFWQTEFDRYSFGYRADGVASIQNKLGALLDDPVLRRILTTPKEELRVRQIMDEGKILLVNLAKGAIGDDSAALLGSFLVTTLGLAAMSRANVATGARPPFSLYVDEFQNFTTLSFANMFSELRKYGVSLTTATQFLSAMPPEVRHAVLGNVGTLVSFRLGAEDASDVSREFGREISERDLVNLPNHHIYLKLMIDGTPSRPFSAGTLPPG